MAFKRVIIRRVGPLFWLLGAFGYIKAIIMKFIIILYIISILVVAHELLRHGLARFKKPQQGKLWGLVGIPVFCALGIAALGTSIAFDLIDGNVFYRSHKFAKQFVITSAENPSYYWTDIAWRALVCFWTFVCGFWFACAAYTRIKSRP